LAIDTSSLEYAGDESLVVAFQEGDHTAFTQIVETYYAVLYARARRQTHSRDDAQDVVQETFLRAYRSLPNFSGDYHLAAWLNRILGNVILDTKRRHGADVRLHTRLEGVRELESLPEDLVTEQAGGRAVLASIEDAIASLSTQHRQAFVLREVEDQSYAEIASVLDISEVNARARVSRARTSLQRSLRAINGSLGVALLSFRGRIVRAFARPLGKTKSASHSARPFMEQGAGTRTGAGIGQTLSQALASPTGQTFSTFVSEAGRWAAPSGTTLSFLASAAVAVVAPASALLAPVASGPSPAPTLPHVVSASPSSLTADEHSLPPTTSSPTTLPAQSTTTTSTTPAVSSTDKAAAAPTPWSWVSSTGAATAAGTPGDASSSAPACPYLQSFPGATPSQIALPPAETSATGASDYLSTETETVPSVTSSFTVLGQGTLSSGSSSAAMQVLQGACLATTANAALVANITNSSTPDNGEVQLRGAYLSSSSNDGTTDTYYRGMAIWLSGPDTGDAPVEFVADVTTNTVDDTAILHAAFYGSISDLMTDGTSTTTPECTNPSTTTTTSDGSTPTSMSPIGSYSVPPAEGASSGNSSGGDGSNDETGGDTDNCAPPSS
jgi:RNA polymerase sigma-70 factor (ECF subfamily)